MKVYQQIDERGFVDDLKTAVVSIVFDNPQDQQQIIKGTLQPAYFRAKLTEELKVTLAEHATVGRNDPSKVKVIFVWDVDSNRWTPICLDRVIIAQLTAS